MWIRSTIKDIRGSADRCDNDIVPVRRAVDELNEVFRYIFSYKCGRGASVPEFGYCALSIKLLAN